MKYVPITIAVAENVKDVTDTIEHTRGAFAAVQKALFKASVKAVTDEVLDDFPAFVESSKSAR